MNAKHAGLIAVVKLLKVPYVDVPQQVCVVCLGLEQHCADPGYSNLLGSCMSAGVCWCLLCCAVLNDCRSYPLIRMRSLTSHKWGEVNRPVVYPEARRMLSIMAHVEPCSEAGVRGVEGEGVLDTVQ